MNEHCIFSFCKGLNVVVNYYKLQFLKITDFFSGFFSKKTEIFYVNFLRKFSRDFLRKFSRDFFTGLLKMTYTSLKTATGPFVDGKTRVKGIKTLRTFTLVTFGAWMARG